MEWNWKENNKQKTLFRSYYCSSCKQIKPCKLLTEHTEWESYCCKCYSEIEQEKGKEYSDYQTVLINKHKERKEAFQQLQFLKDYLGCKDCGSLAVDAYSLYVESKIVCQPCLMKREGGSSSPISFLGEQKKYKKQGIELGEWLDNYQKLPVNNECVKKWLRDKEHLNNCECLEREVKELLELFGGSLKKIEEKLAKCSCEKSEKVRVDSDYYAWCERCQEPIPVASKKRVIKNRNDPKFWGLKIEEKVLCGLCLESKKGKMPPLRKAEFNRYRKIGRL